EQVETNQARAVGNGDAGEPGCSGSREAVFGLMRAYASTEWCAITSTVMKARKYVERRVAARRRLGRQPAGKAGRGRLAKDVLAAAAGRVRDGYYRFAHGYSLHGNAPPKRKRTHRYGNRTVPNGTAIQIAKCNCRSSGPAPA